MDRWESPYIWDLPVPTNPPPIQYSQWLYNARERKPLTPEELKSQEAGVFINEDGSVYRYRDEPGSLKWLNEMRLRMRELDPQKRRNFKAAADAIERGIKKRAAASKITSAEQEKQKVLAVQEVLESKGVPSTHDTGPIHTILKMADFKTPKGATAAARRKTRKGGRRRRGKTARRI